MDGGSAPSAEANAIGFDIPLSFTGGTALSGAPLDLDFGSQIFGSYNASPVNSGAGAGGGLAVALVAGLAFAFFVRGQR